MKEAVRIRDDARRRHRDDLVQSGLDVSSGSFSIRVWSMSVCAVGITFEQIPGVTDDLHRGRRARQGQRQVQRDRHAASARRRRAPTSEIPEPRP